MDLQHNYLLQMQYCSTGSTPEATTLQLEIKTFPLLAQAVLHLLSLPMDQFDPGTAVEQSQPRYLESAAILDIGQGQRLLETYRLKPEDETAEKNGLYIFLAPGISEKAVNEPISIIPKRDSIDAITVWQLLKKSEDGRFLLPTRSYYHIFQGIVRQLYLDTALQATGKHYVSFVGERLHEVSVNSRGDIHYQAIFDNHFFDNPRAAFAKLLLIPSDYFDVRYAQSQQLEYFFMYARMYDMARNDEVLAESITNPYQHALLKDLAPSGKGRYLFIKEGLGALAALLNCDWTAHPECEPSRHFLHLDEWSEDDPSRLRPTALPGKLLAPLAVGVSAGFPHAAFEVRIRSTPHLDEQLLSAQSRIADVIEHYHTESFDFALYKMLNLHTYQFDPQAVKNYLLPSEHKEAVLLDKNRQPLAQVYNDPGNGMFQSKGLYMGFTASFLEMASAIVDTEVLRHGAPEPIMKDDFLWFQTGVWQQETLEPTLGYEKIAIQAAAHYLFHLARRTPDVLLVAPQDLNDFPYWVTLHWRGTTTGSATAISQHDFRGSVGFDSAHSAVSFMHEFADEVFSAAAMQGDDYYIYLKEMALWNPRRVRCLERTLESDGQSTRYRMTHQDELPAEQMADIINAYRAVLSKEDPGKQTPGDGNVQHHRKPTPRQAPRIKPTPGKSRGTGG